MITSGKYLLAIVGWSIMELLLLRGGFDSYHGDLVEMSLCKYVNSRPGTNRRELDISGEYCQVDIPSRCGWAGKMEENLSVVCRS